MTLQIEALAAAPGSEVDFGAEVAACDLSRLSDADFAALERAVLTQHVVVVREQAGLAPQHQFELTRRFDLMRPAIEPRKVYAHPWRAGDLVIFNNRGVWHSVVGALTPSDTRVYHQCNLAGSSAPLAAPCPVTPS